MNKDNIITQIPRVALETKVSQKTNNEYTIMKVFLDSDYAITVFLNPEQKKILKDHLSKSKKTHLDIED